MNKIGFRMMPHRKVKVISGQKIPTDEVKMMHENIDKKK